MFCLGVGLYSKGPGNRSRGFLGRIYCPNLSIVFSMYTFPPVLGNNLSTSFFSKPVNYVGKSYFPGPGTALCFSSSTSEWGLYKFTGTIFLGTGCLNGLDPLSFSYSALSKPNWISYVSGPGSLAAYCSLLLNEFLSTCEVNTFYAAGTCLYGFSGE